MEWFVRRGGRLVAGRRVERKQDAGSRRFSKAIVCLVLLGALVTAAWAFATNYVYDANGRLVVVTNDAGESVRYVYDAMGNLTAIERLGANDLAIFAFNPTRGAPGVQVRVRGHGFSTNPADNALNFNGVPAVVSTASGNELVATVPAAATTGPLMVTVSGYTATSTNDFIVDEASRPPVIYSVSPLIGAVGTPIAVTGEWLSPMANQTTVGLNLRPSLPSSATNTQVIFPIPSNAGSGKVTVGTPFGTTTSTQDVVVVSSGIDPALVVQVKRLVIDAPPQGFATTNTGEYAAALFEGTIGEYLNVQFAGIDAANIAYSLYDTMNRQVVNGTVTQANPTVLLSALNATGTYLLLMKPATGPAAWNMAIERVKPVEADGDAVDVQTEAAGQWARLTFGAQAGQHLGLGINDLAISTGTSVVVRVYRPDGSQLTNTTCPVSAGGCGLNLSIQVTGAYSVVVTPQSGAQTMSFRTTLSSDMIGVLQPDVVHSLTLPRRGQNARLTFTGTVGQTLALQVTGQATVPVGRQSYYRVYRPNGTQLVSTSAASSMILNLANLPETGEYLVFVDPDQGATLQAQMLLATGITGDEEVNGDSGEYETMVPGQNVYLTFAATDGQHLGLGISDLMVSTGSYVTVRVYRTDGGLLTSTTCSVSHTGCGLNLSITATGTYSLVILPQNSSQAMSFRTTLSTDAMGELIPDSPQTLALPRRGQNARLTFTGTAGETLALQVAGQATAPVGRSSYYRVYRPNGTQLASTSTASSTTLNLWNLPETGQYVVFVDPYYGETLQAEMLLATGATGDEEVDGESGSYSTAISGQNVYLTLTVEAGKNLGVGVTDVITPGSTSPISIRGRSPSATSGWELNCSAANDGCEADLPNLEAGTHSIEIRPPANGDGTMSFRITLSSDVVGHLLRDTPTEVNLLRRGQNGRFTFAGSQGETVALQVLGQVTAPTEEWRVSYEIYRPDGSYWIAMATATQQTLNISNLPVTGTYTIFVDPSGGAKLQAAVLLASGARDLIEVDGASESVETTVLGEYAYLAFTAEAGANLGLGISDLTTSRWTANTASVEVLRPNGSSLASRGCDVQYSKGCDLNLPGLEAGTYMIRVIPPYDGQHQMTMSFAATLSSDVVGVLQPDVVHPLTLPRRGQNARLTFTGTAGEAVALQVAGQTTVPAGRQSYYVVNRPNGTHLTGTATTSDTTLSLANLPETGEYLVFVDPGQGATLQAQVTLATAP